MWWLCLQGRDCHVALLFLLFVSPARCQEPTHCQHMSTHTMKPHTHTRSQEILLKDHIRSAFLYLGRWDRSLGTTVKFIKGIEHNSADVEVQAHAHSITCNKNIIATIGIIKEFCLLSSCLWWQCPIHYTAAMLCCKLNFSLSHKWHHISDSNHTLCKT
jgi:hypothetical protein